MMEHTTLVLILKFQREEPLSCPNRGKTKANCEKFQKASLTNPDINLGYNRPINLKSVPPLIPRFAHAIAYTQSISLK